MEECPEAEPVNACGGCDPLPGEVDAPCGGCDTGVWTCEEGGLVCARDLGVSAPPESCGEDALCVDGSCVPLGPCATDDECPESEGYTCVDGRCAEAESLACLAVEAVGTLDGLEDERPPGRAFDAVWVGTVLTLGVAPTALPGSGPWSGTWTIDAPEESTSASAESFAVEGVTLVLDVEGTYRFTLTRLDDAEGRSLCDSDALDIVVTAVSMPRSCDDLDCAAEQRVCDEGATTEDARCGDCQDGFENDEGVCVVGCSSDSACEEGAWCPTDTTERRCSPRPVLGGVEIPFQWVPQGTFTMGSPEDEVGRQATEPQVSVTLSGDYFVQRTPVTQRQWAAVMEAWNVLPAEERRMSGWSDATPAFGTTPSCFRSESETSCTTSGSSPNHPVERVSWWDAVVYANALSILEGLTPCYTLSECGTNGDFGGVGGGCARSAHACGVFDSVATFGCRGVSFAGKACSGYRLLTEAEWERAARGGTTTATYLGDLSGAVGSCTELVPQPNLDPIAWWCGNSDFRTHAVAGKSPNTWGLYDMLGNVMEWTWTPFELPPAGGMDPLGTSTGERRVLRGGSWSRNAQFARAASRVQNDFGDRRAIVGFRLARSAP